MMKKIIMHSIFITAGLLFSGCSSLGLVALGGVIGVVSTQNSSVKLQSPVVFGTDRASKNEKMHTNPCKNSKYGCVW